MKELGWIVGLTVLVAIAVNVGMSVFETFESGDTIRELLNTIEFQDGVLHLNMSGGLSVENQVRLLPNNANQDPSIHLTNTTGREYRIVPKSNGILEYQ
jgi:hypothetical protein